MVNKVILVGNVGIDPEIRTTESGVKVARVRLATTERYYDRQTNEAKELTEWHTITLWRGLADVVDKYVRKGSQLYVEGRLRTREWTDKENIKRYATEIVADEVHFVDAKGDVGVTQSTGATNAVPAGSVTERSNAGVQESMMPSPAPYTGDYPKFEDLADDEELPF